MTSFYPHAEGLEDQGCMIFLKNMTKIDAKVAAKSS